MDQQDAISSHLSAERSAFHNITWETTTVNHAVMHLCMHALFLTQNKNSPRVLKSCFYVNESHYSTGAEDPIERRQMAVLVSHRAFGWIPKDEERGAKKERPKIYIDVLLSQKMKSACIYTSSDRHPHKCSRVLAIKAVQKVFFFNALTHTHTPCGLKEAGVTIVTNKTNSTRCTLQHHNSVAGEAQPEALLLSLWKPKGIAHTVVTGD